MNENNYFYLRLEEVVDCLFDFELIEHSSHFLITYFKSGFDLAADWDFEAVYWLNFKWTTFIN